jgi:hypothetical protein
MACRGLGFWYVPPMRFFLIGIATLLALTAYPAERIFSFNDSPTDQTPAGFQSIVIGQGGPGDWKIVPDEVSSPATGLNAAMEKTVLGQMSRLPLNNRFPILLFDEVIADFKLTTRFKIIDGVLEQSAGAVFRFQNESNYYVIRADALTKSFRCYKIENGILKPPIGPEMNVALNKWHTLVVRCEGTRILCALDGQDVIKLIDNNSRKAGKFGFWTKSDSVAHFADAQITYTPHEPLAHALIRDALQEYPRVLDLQIFAARTDGAMPVIVAGKEQKDIGRAGSQGELDVIAGGKIYHGKGDGSVSVTMPLRDRNGDPIAAVRITLKSFPGQTEANAFVRAQPVVKLMQTRVQSLDELIE